MTLLSLSYLLTVAAAFGIGVILGSIAHNLVSAHAEQTRPVFEPTRRPPIVPARRTVIVHADDVTDPAA